MSYLFVFFSEVDLWPLNQLAAVSWLRILMDESKRIPLPATGPLTNHPIHSYSSQRWICGL